jgi:hypothetical protein
MHKNKKRNGMIKILKDSQNQFTAISLKYYSKLMEKSRSLKRAKKGGHRDPPLHLLLIVGRGCLCSWFPGAGKICSGQDNVGTGSDFLQLSQRQDSHFFTLTR